MKLKIASYNISGGFFNDKDETEYLDKERASGFDDRLLNQIIETINNEDIDVICFQEIITTERVQYINKICDGTELKNYEYYELSENNLVKDTNSGIAVLSKYPLEVLKREFFPNPGLTKTTKSGNTYYLYDKGYMVVYLLIESKRIKLLTHHGFPYKVFDSTAEDNMQVFEFFDSRIDEIKPDIITGDFNVEDMMILMPNTNSNYKRTINSITTVDGEKLDDILVHKDINYSSNVLKLLSDHFMVISVIEI